MRGNLRRAEPKNIDPTQNDWIGGFVRDGGGPFAGFDVTPSISGNAHSLVAHHFFQPASGARRHGSGIAEPQDQLRVPLHAVE